jgi:hypothetical protein
MDWVGYLDWGLKALTAAVFVFVWRIHIDQQAAKLIQQSASAEAVRKHGITDLKIEQIEHFMELNARSDTRIVQLEKDLARIEGNMLTIETLKRVEIYMELILARAGIDQKVDLTSRNRKTDL